MNPLIALRDHGQSVWLDYIQQSLIASGGLRRLVEEDGLRGVTSNPAIFQKAVTGGDDYLEALEELRESDLPVMQLYEKLAVRDIQDAADVLRPVYEESEKRDGYVSLEVSPFLAHDTAGTVAEARRLWAEVARPNVMIKVPGTKEGIPAVEQLIGEGVNVNVTLLFSQQVYAQVAEAYLRGLEKRVAAGGGVSGVASVASFFVSRIDAAVDAQLRERLRHMADPEEQQTLEGLLGKAAIANAKLAYEIYKDIIHGRRWQALSAKGAQPQRLLWASTGTKDPSYSDVLYVEELIGADTVNTLPPATMDAFRDHGKPRASLEENVEAARSTMNLLELAGVSMDAVTAGLVRQGVRLFAEAFDQLLNALDARCRLAVGIEVGEQSYKIPDRYQPLVKDAIEDWRISGKVRRLWSADSTLWTGSDEDKWLGWLGIAEELRANSHHLGTLAEDIRAAGFSHALLLGMGGSSLCPEVLKMTFGKMQGHPELLVLDSTDPAQVLAFERKVDLDNTIFIVSSKSGSTLEPNIFLQYFYHRVEQTLGAGKAGERFIAITDPGSKLEQAAKEKHFRHIFHGVAGIGGRYSALSNFGLCPAAVLGLDTQKFLARADEMAVACSPCVAAPENPGVVLGVILGVLGNHGRDKLTLIASPAIHDLGAWLEQLVAESTGKEGRALIPVDRETPGPPAVYGDDRVFVYLRLASDYNAAQDAAVEVLENAGLPVVRIAVRDVYDIGQEFFRWEIATAVAGAVMGIHPFNQPDVEASKIVTKELTTAYEKTGSLPQERPIFEEHGIKLYADAENAQSLHGNDSLTAYLKAHFDRLKPGDYFALLAYVEMNESHDVLLQEIRDLVRDHKKVATCLGFGPRFLHSTGQAYKGGPNSGVFLQITCDDAEDVAVPGQKYTFGVVKAAQARGDLQVLEARKRRALRVHLGSDVEAGLKAFQKAAREAL